jgi:hypothetical protein
MDHPPEATLSAVNDTLEVGIDQGYLASVGFQLSDPDPGGTAFQGVVSFEGCVLPGTWVAAAARDGTDPTNLATSASEAALGVWIVDGAGYRKVRARLSSSTQGGVRVNARPTASPT